MPLLPKIEVDSYGVRPVQKEAYFKKGLRGLPPEASELVIHCDRPIDDSSLPPDSIHREVDYVIFKLLLQSEHIESTTWKTLR